MSVITVCGSPYFAVELASVAAKYTEKNILIIDLDGFNPSLDYILKIKTNPVNITTFRDISESSLNIIVDVIEKNMFTRDILFECVQRKRKKLYALTGSYDEDSYARMRHEPVVELVKRANELFDVTILITNTFLYDSITKAAIEISDLVLLPTNMNILDVRTINNKFEYAIDASKLSGNSESYLDRNKFKQIMFNFNSNIDIPVKVCKALCRFDVVGVIPYSERRWSYVNKRTTYINVMERSVTKQYSKVLNTIGIKTKKPKVAMSVIPRRLFNKLFSKLFRKKG